MRRCCDTAERIWDAMTSRRMYLTGGIGPSHSNEGFTRDYDLPDETAYAETCAPSGWCCGRSRMLQFDGDGKYADVIERALYNGVLSGVSLDGTHFFYENPLASLRPPPQHAVVRVPVLPAERGAHHRQRRRLLLLDWREVTVAASVWAEQRDRRRRRQDHGRETRDALPMGWPRER